MDKFRSRILLLVLIVPLISLPSAIAQHSSLLRATLLWCLGIVCLAHYFYMPILFRGQRLIILITILLLVGALLSGEAASRLSGDPNDWFGIASVLSSIAIGLVVAPVVPSKFFKFCFYISTVLAAAVIALEIPIILSGGRVQGLVGQSSLSATMLGVGILSSYFYLQSVQRTWWHYGSVGLLCVTLLLTGARSAIMPLALGCIILVIYYIVKDRKAFFALISGRRQLILAMVVSLGVLFALIAPGRVKNIEYFGDSVEYRAQLLQYGLGRLQTMPMWGYGPGGIEELGPKDLPGLLAESFSDEGATIASTHNVFLDFLLEYGWFAALLFVCVCAFALFRGLTSHGNTYRALALVLFYVLLQGLVNPVWQESDTLSWILIMTLILGPEVVKRNEKIDANARSHSWPNKAILEVVVIFCLLLPLMLWADNLIAVRRIDHGFVFPLQASKSNIINGSSNRDGRLVWNSNIPFSYHHTYAAADIHVSVATKVLAAKSGSVIWVRDRGCNGTGEFPALAIKADDGFIYYYAHLLPGSLRVMPRTRVTQGDEIAEVGDSKCAQGTAPHLHFDISRYWGVPRSALWSNVNIIDPQPHLIRAYTRLP